MKKILLKTALGIICVGLTACSNNVSFDKVMSSANPFRSNQEAKESVPSSVNKVSGGIALDSIMDANDKEKMSHALDKPLGKTTQWVNHSTRTHFSVEPVSKFAMKGNPFCRKYKVTYSQNNMTKETNGAACVSATDSSWQVVN